MKTGFVGWRHQMEIFSALLDLSEENPVDSPHKDQWRVALMFFFLCTPEQTTEQTVQMLIWDATVPIVTSL